MKHLLNLFMLLAFLLPINALASDSTTPMVAVGEGEPMDFSGYSSTSYPDLSAAESITVTGTWTDAQVIALKYALKNSTTATDYNDKLLSVDMSGMEFSGDITSGFTNFFRNNTVLTEVILSQEVTAGTVSFNYTFNGCEALTTITNLNKFTGVSNLGWTFYNCPLLKEVTFSDVTNTKSVPFDYTFYGCEALTTITGLENFKGINGLASAFRDCSSLKEITLAEVENIKSVSFSSAFYGCKALTTITGLDKFTGANTFDSAFRDCSSLTSITLPEGTTYTGTVSFSSAFLGCKALTTITGLDKFTGASTFVQAFWDCSSITSIALPEGTTNTSTVSFQSAFYGCKALATITGLDKFTAVSSFYQAFQNCSSLTSVTLSAETNTNAISFNSTFRGCTALTTINNLDKFTGISNLYQTFYNCSSLTSVSLGNVAPAESTNLSYTFTDTNPNCLKYLPAGDNTTAALDASTGAWKNYSNFIIDGIAYKNITLTDEKPFYCPTAFTVPADQTITYYRDFTGNLATRDNGWNTLCLPFEAEMRVNGDAGDAPAKLPFAADDDTNGQFWLKPFTGGSGETVNFDYTTDGTAIQANTPYLIALPGSEYGAAGMHLNPVMEFTASDITVAATPDTSELTHRPQGSDYSYVGNYDLLKMEDIYILRRGEGEESDVFACPPSGTEAWVLPFRAYFEVEGAPGDIHGVRMLSIGHGEGGATGGLNPESFAPEDEADKAYKIMTPDGLRIVKGDKWYTIDGVEIPN